MYLCPLDRVEAALEVNCNRIDRVFWFGLIRRLAGRLGMSKALKLHLRHQLFLYGHELIRNLVLQKLAKYPALEASIEDRALLFKTQLHLILDRLQLGLSGPFQKQR